MERHDVHSRNWHGFIPTHGEGGGIEKRMRESNICKVTHRLLLIHHTSYRCHGVGHPRTELFQVHRVTSHHSSFSYINMYLRKKAINRRRVSLKCAMLLCMHNVLCAFLSFASEIQCNNGKVLPTH